MPTCPLGSCGHLLSHVNLSTMWNRKDPTGAGWEGVRLQSDGRERAPGQSTADPMVITIPPYIICFYSNLLTKPLGNPPSPTHKSPFSGLPGKATQGFHLQHPERSQEFSDTQ